MRLVACTEEGRVVPVCALDYVVAAAKDEEVIFG